MGDVAMLQGMVRHVREHKPSAEIYVFTESPGLLERYCPGTLPISSSIKFEWSQFRILPFPRRLMPSCVFKWVKKSEKWFKRKLPRFCHHYGKILKPFLRSGSVGCCQLPTSDLYEAVRSIDALFIAGGGYFAEHFLGQCDSVIETAEIAVSVGKPVYFCGQGFGPLENPSIVARLTKLLKRAKRVSIREAGNSADFLDDIGISDDKVMCTGDDALTLIRDCDSHRSRTDIGLNLRVSGYSGLSSETLVLFRDGLGQFLDARQTHSSTIPISFFENEDDNTRVNDLMNGLNNHDSTLVDDSPAGIVAAVGKCRMVITGSYHAAVFALSQGVPVIALVASEYYKRKFGGLLLQFGTGIHLLSLDQINDANAVFERISQVYDSAPEVSGPLLAAAARQQTLAGQYYSTIFAELNDSVK